MDYEYDAMGRISEIGVDGRVATFEYDALGRLSGSRLNGRQLVTSDYGPMDVDVATEADGYSPFTAVANPVASAIFASPDSIAYARPRGPPFGAIRFDATMARFTSRMRSKRIRTTPMRLIVAFR
jgi:YD repeat-containing protein